MEVPLLPGQSYDVMIENLWRLLATGKSMEEARVLVLTKAQVSEFPCKPAQDLSSSPQTLEDMDLSGATIH